MGLSAMTEGAEDPSTARIRRELRALREGRKPAHWPKKVWAPVAEKLQAIFTRDMTVDEVTEALRPRFGRRLLHPQELADARGNVWNGQGLEYYAARLCVSGCSSPERAATTSPLRRAAG